MNTVSHYELLDKLGEGGMGVVYKARDTHLDRVVAIKLLPAGKVSNPERKRRFVQEAKAASSLNHPNIVTIHDIATDNGHDFIVMEFVPGKTLDQLIPRHGLRVNELLKYSVQIADALARAHSAGIIHRDVKPGNIMVGDGGVVKVLDFGLAKLAEDENNPVDEATRTMRPRTEEGLIVGTASYMSPEQAEGKQVDARSDVFSFGAVLYEMATGQRAFHGDSSMSTLAAILNKEPRPASDVAPEIPRDLAKIINRCLRKDPEKRFQHMVDLKVALAELKEESDSGALSAPSVPQRKNRRALYWISGAIALAVAAAASIWFFQGYNRPPEAAMTSTPLTTYAGSEVMPAFSPDGNQVAFAWDGNQQDNLDIYVKLIRTESPLRLTTDTAPDFGPAWSPDGRSIAFLRRKDDSTQVLLVPALGGPERRLTELRPQYLGPFSNTPFLAWVPDGDWLIFSDAGSSDEPSALFLFSTKTGERRRLTSPPKTSDGDSGGAISPDGQKVAFIRVFSVGISHLYLLDLSKDLRPAGEPVRIAANLQNCYSPAWTPDGKEIVFCAVEQGNQRLWRVAASSSGLARPLGSVGENGDEPAISPKGSRLAYVVGSIDANIWKLPISKGRNNAPVRLISSSRTEMNAQYSPDGKRIAFASDRSGDFEIWTCNADGSNAIQLTSLGAHSGTPRWAPDGRRLAFDSNKEGRFQIYVMDATGGVPERLTNSPADDAAPSWSRDGKEIYFSSKRTGRWEVWQMASTGGEAVQVTRQGGFTPFESPDRRVLYYQKTEENSEIWKVPVGGGQETKVVDSVGGRQFAVAEKGIYFIRPGPTPSLQFFNFETEKAVEIARIANRTWMGLSVSPDGQSAIYTQRDQAGSDLMLVENFR